MSQMGSLELPQPPLSPNVTNVMSQDLFSFCVFFCSINKYQNFIKSGSGKKFRYFNISGSGETGIQMIFSGSGSTRTGI